MKRQYRGLKLWLPRILSRTTLYFFYMSLIMFSLYILGNFQHFSNDTFRMLFLFMDIYFYTFLVLTISNMLITLLWRQRGAGKMVRFYLKSVFQALLIFGLYILSNLLQTLFSGV